MVRERNGLGSELVRWIFRGKEKGTPKEIAAPGRDDSIAS